jgi:hypothetical protein
MRAMRWTLVVALALTAGLWSTTSAADAAPAKTSPFAGFYYPCAFSGSGYTDWPITISDNGNVRGSFLFGSAGGNVGGWGDLRGKVAPDGSIKFSGSATYPVPSPGGFGYVSYTENFKFSGRVSLDAGGDLVVTPDAGTLTTWARYP